MNKGALKVSNNGCPLLTKFTNLTLPPFQLCNFKNSDTVSTILVPQSMTVIRHLESFTFLNFTNNYIWEVTSGAPHSVLTGATSRSMEDKVGAPHRGLTTEIFIGLH